MNYKTYYNSNFNTNMNNKDAMRHLSGVDQNKKLPNYNSENKIEKELGYWYRNKRGNKKKIIYK